MKEKPVKLELISISAADEKKLAPHKKNLDLYFGGLNTCKAGLLGYAFLIGNELNVAKECLPHGQFETFVEQQYGLPSRTQLRWRDHADCIIEKWNERKELEKSTDGKSATVALLKSPLDLAGKKKFSKGEQAAILEIVPEVMERKGMVQFIEDCKMMKGKVHQKHTPPKELTPEERAEAETKQNEALVAALIADINLLADDKDLKVLAAVSAKTRKALEEARIKLGHKLESLKNHKDTKAQSK
jgi:hypothetical protein